MLNAGPELDGLVAEQIMQLDVPDLIGQGWTIGKYSTDYGAAWDVRNKVKTWSFRERSRFTNELVKQVAARVGTDEGAKIEGAHIFLFVEPIDICLAALRARGIDA